MRKLFPKLSEPGYIGQLKIKNRFVMAPASTNYSSPDGSVTDRLLRHYQERARGGVGLIIVEFAYIDNEASKSLHAQLGIYDDQLIPGLSLLARVIQENGARAAIQIEHSGLQRSLGTYPIVGPSRIGKEYLGGHEGILPKELTIEEIQKITLSFGQAAIRAKKAGFDMVEILGGGGYLINEFLSAYTNRRNDMYGGSLKDRMKFPLEVIRNVRQSVGKNYPLGIRINGNDYVDGGVTIEEAKALAKELEKEGIDVIHVMAGTHQLRSRMTEPMLLPMGNKIQLAEAIKSVVNIPIIASGSIVIPELAEEIIEQKKADFVSMARSLIADPEFPIKVLEGRPEEIRPCIRCNEGCLQRGTFIAQPVKCTVNVAAGFEEWLRIERSSEPKKVLVVGGGPGGMEAAVTAAKKGHKVTLIEREEALGGKLIEASFANFKKDLRRLVGYYSAQLYKLGVEITLGKEAKVNDIRDEGYQAVILATGSNLIVPEIPGIQGENVISCLDVLRGQAIKENQIIVVGGGMVGCEVALFLAEMGKRVRIVEMLDEIGIGVDSIAMEVLLEKFMEYKVESFVGLRVIEVTKDGVIALNRFLEKKSVQGQRIVLSTGFASNDSLFKELSLLGVDVHEVGDCLEPRKIYEAIHEGNRAARYL